MLHEYLVRAGRFDPAPGAGGGASCSGGIFLGKAAHVVHGLLEALLHLLAHLLFQVEDRRRLGQEFLLALGGSLLVLHQELAGGLDVLPGDIPHVIMPGGGGGPGRQQEGQTQAQDQEQTQFGEPFIPGGRRQLA